MAPDEETRATAGASSGEDEAAGTFGLTGKLLAGRYRVESRLGQGGMAAVYRATDERLNRTVVVKVPHAALLVDPGFRKRFAAEVNNLAKLEHPNIIPIHDVGEDEGVPFAVVQLLRGGDLVDRIERAGGRLTPEQVLEWLPRIAETLDFVRDRGFVHRDVSPGNIIFDDHGNAHLSDFGIATAVSAGDADPTASEYSNLTRPGGFVGNATYAPPESIERKLNPAYDQYSLGVVVYEALAGALPFDRGTAEAMLVAKNTKPPAPLDQRVPGLPDGVVAAVMRAVSRDPAKRFESAMAFTEAFRAGLETPSSKTMVVPPPADPGTVVVDVSPHVRKRWPWAAVAAGLLLAAGAGGAWVFAPWRPVPGPKPALVEDTNAAAATPGPVEFTAGSTDAEKAAALALCQKLQGTDCKASNYADETLRTVTIGPIELDPHEVTNEEFAAFVAKTGYRTTAERKGYSWDPTFKGTNLSWRAPTRDVSYRDRLDHPVVHVSAADAATFCKYRGERLPTEDEWEYGARGTDRRTFPWGDEWDGSRAVWNTDGTRPVGSHPNGASWNGLQDMAGNVWEWTSTKTARQTPIVKGGSWFELDGALLRGATRMELESSDWTSADVGFRCVRDLGSQAPGSQQASGR